MNDGRSAVEPARFPPLRSARAITPQGVLDDMGRIAEVVVAFERSLIAAGAFMPARVPLAATATLDVAMLYWLPVEPEGARIVLRHHDNQSAQRLATATLPEQTRALATVAEAEREAAMNLPCVLATINDEIAWRSLTELERAQRATDQNNSAWRVSRGLVLFDFWVPPKGFPFRNGDKPVLISVESYDDDGVERPNPPPADRVALGNNVRFGYACLATLDASALAAVVADGFTITPCGKVGEARFYRLHR